MYKIHQVACIYDSNYWNKRIVNTAKHLAFLSLKGGKLSLHVFNLNLYGFSMSYYMLQQHWIATDGDGFRVSSNYIECNGHRVIWNPQKQDVVGTRIISFKSPIRKQTSKHKYVNFPFKITVFCLRFFHNTKLSKQFSVIGNRCQQQLPECQPIHQDLQ